MSQSNIDPERIARRKQELTKMIERYEKVANGYRATGQLKLAETYDQRASVARVELESYE
jgi:hypothetical protein